MTDSRTTELDSHLAGIGDRLRDERVRAGLSQRELARRLGLSPSMISQLESGASKPSVGTLYAIVTELNLSLDRVIRGDDFHGGSQPEAPSPVVRPPERQAIDLESGVRWEELTSTSEAGIDFIHAVYEPGGSSTADGSLMRHEGREYGFVLSGVLGVQLGFQEYRLHPGDSIAFDSTRPHRYFNPGEEQVRSIWFVLGHEDRDRPGQD